MFAGTFLPGGVGSEGADLGRRARELDPAPAFSSAVVERAFGMRARPVMVATGVSLGPPGLPEALRTWAMRVCWAWRSPSGW